MYLKTFRSEASSTREREIAICISYTIYNHKQPRYATALVMVRFKLSLYTAIYHDIHLNVDPHTHSAVRVEVRCSDQAAVAVAVHCIDLEFLEVLRHSSHSDLGVAVR